MDRSEILLYTGLTLLVLWGLKKVTESIPDDDSGTRKKKPKDDKPISVVVPRITLTVKPTGDFNFDVVGESHYQSALREIAGPESSKGKQYVCDAVILHQPDNLYDKNACAVVIENSLVGYLPQADAKSLVTSMKTKDEPSGFAVQCKACITGGWISESGYVGKYGVVLDMDASSFPALPIQKEMLRFFGKKAPRELTRGSARAIREELAKDEPELFSEWLAFQEIVEHLHSEEGRAEFYEIKKPSMKAMRDAYSHFRETGLSPTAIKDEIDEFVEYMIEQNPNLEK